MAWHAKWPGWLWISLNFGRCTYIIQYLVLFKDWLMMKRIELKMLIVLHYNTLPLRGMWIIITEGITRCGREDDVLLKVVPSWFTVHNLYISVMCNTSKINANCFTLPYPWEVIIINIISERMTFCTMTRGMMMFCELVKVVPSWISVYNLCVSVMWNTSKINANCFTLY